MFNSVPGAELAVFARTDSGYIGKLLQESFDTSSVVTKLTLAGFCLLELTAGMKKVTVLELESVHYNFQQYCYLPENI